MELVNFTAEPRPLLGLRSVFDPVKDMPKTLQQFEARLARIEKEIAELKASQTHSRAEPWYRQVVGDFADDEAYLQIIRLGKQIRRGKLRG